MQPEDGRMIERYRKLAQRRGAYLASSLADRCYMPVPMIMHDSVSGNHNRIDGASPSKAAKVLQLNTIKREQWLLAMILVR